jgi:hypothetical protein
VFCLALEDAMNLSPGDARLEQMRDFYAYMEREVAAVIERYRSAPPTSPCTTSGHSATKA